MPPAITTFTFGEHIPVTFEMSNFLVWVYDLHNAYASVINNSKNVRLKNVAHHQPFVYRSLPQMTHNQSVNFETSKTITVVYLMNSLNEL